MLIYMIALMTAAIVVVLHDWRKEANRWAACFLLFASTGGWTDVLIEHGFSGWADAVMFINQTITPYAVLVFALVFTGRLERFQPTIRSTIKLALLLPIGIMALITPFKPEMDLDYWLMLGWTGPYYLSACWLLVVAYCRESEADRKRSLLLTSVIMVPTLLAVLLFVSVARAIDPHFNFFSYLAAFFAFSIAIAVPGVFLYGVLGVKLRFERDSMEATIQAMGSGATLLQHTVKNEIAKIAVSAENLKSMLGAEETLWSMQGQPTGGSPANAPMRGEPLQPASYTAYEAAAEQIRIIEHASDQMLAMTERLKDRMSVVTLVEQPCRLDVLVDRMLDTIRSQCEQQHIEMTSHYALCPLLRCDAVHVREALGNVLANAIDAMPQGGKLHVTLERSGRHLQLSVKDTGEGIPPEQAARVFEPFYSTKQRKHNYGLGLSYVYMVMQRTGGLAKLSSRPGEGTVVQLKFPYSKVIRTGGNVKEDGDDRRE